MPKKRKQKRVGKRSVSQELLMLPGETAADEPDQKGILSKYFPSIRSRQEVLDDIHANAALCEQFFSWKPEAQKDFLDCCTGVKGMKMLYDGIFKEVFDPDSTPERLETLLSLIIGRKVKLKQVLPNDSVRLGAESSLIYTDIMVELQDGSLADVEMQRIAYDFPGQRCACYAADHLLRQYKRVRSEKQKGFRYQDVKNVYTIVFFEKSTAALKNFPDCWVHRFEQCSNSGLKAEFLQEFYWIALDIFAQNLQNKSISNELDAWLAFLSFDSPERVLEVSSYHPMFHAMYQDVYEIMENTEKVMNMYSKELAETDRNTVLFMIDRMQAELEEQKAELKEKDAKLEEQGAKLEEKDVELREKDAKLEEQERLIRELKTRLAEQ